MVWHTLDRFRDLGLLLLRLGLGSTLMFVHGMNKLFGGPDRWEQVGASAQAIGLDFLPTFWGFMAGLAEFGGGLLLMLGLLFRPTILFLLIPTMIVAAAANFAGLLSNNPWHAVELGIVLFGLFFIGPGDYSLDAALDRRRRFGLV